MGRLIRAVAAALLFVPAACGGPVAPSATTPSVVEAIDAPTWAAAICEAADQLSLAVGDPTTGERSPAWNDFEQALSSGDPERIEATANSVLGYLSQGARAANAALGFDPGREAASTWWDLLDALAGGVRMLRDATTEQDATRINEGRALLAAAYEAYYERADDLMVAVPLGGAELPCR